MKPSVRAGAVASFTIGDVVSPDAVTATRLAGPELAVRGRIVYFSDSGPRHNHFAVVDVGGIHSPLVVPVDRLKIEEEWHQPVSADAPHAAAQEESRKTRL